MITSVEQLPRVKCLLLADIPPSATKSGYKELFQWIPHYLIGYPVKFEKSDEIPFGILKPIIGQGTFIYDKEDWPPYIAYFEIIDDSTIYLSNTEEFRHPVYKSGEQYYTTMQLGKDGSGRTIYINRQIVFTEAVDILKEFEEYAASRYNEFSDRVDVAFMKLRNKQKHQNSQDLSDEYHTSSHKLQKAQRFVALAKFFKSLLYYGK